MRAFLSRCETDSSEDVDDGGVSEVGPLALPDEKPVAISSTDDSVKHMSALIAEAKCEEAAAGL